MDGNHGFFQHKMMSFSWREPRMSWMNIGLESMDFNRLPVWLWSTMLFFLVKVRSEPFRDAVDSNGWLDELMVVMIKKVWCKMLEYVAGSRMRVNAPENGVFFCSVLKFISAITVVMLFHFPMFLPLCKNGSCGRFTSRWRTQGRTIVACQHQCPSGSHSPQIGPGVPQHLAVSLVGFLAKSI